MNDVAMDESHHENAGLTAFESNLAIADKITKKGFDKYVQELPGFYESFTPKDKEQKLKCSDERIKSRGMANPGGLLFDLIIHEVPDTELADHYKANKIKILSSHDGCGAAKAAMSKELNAPQNDWAKINAWAKKKTEAFVNKFAKSHGFTFEHISENELEPQGHIHPGTAIYLDDVGGFNPQDVPGLEQGYVVSGPIAKHPVDAVRALIMLVAFGPGNAGDLIRKRRLMHTFSVHIIAPDEEKLRLRKNEVERMLNALPSDVRQYIRFDGTHLA